MVHAEFSAAEIRRFLQKLFPQRKLVLSQFTFFSHAGVARPTGTTFRRGRRCFCTPDLLSIAAVLALKEEGIPLKNLSTAPALIQEAAPRIFEFSDRCRIVGCGGKVELMFEGEHRSRFNLDDFLPTAGEPQLFWGLDLTLLATQLMAVSRQGTEERVLRAA